MNFLTIIPARSGSKEIKNKNISSFNDKPLIYWTIKSAKECHYIKDIVVSTDSKKIKKIAEKYKCYVPFLREKNLAKPSSLMIDVVNNVVNKVDLKRKKYDAVIILQPTSPLRTADHISKACKIFEKNNSDSLVSVCKIHHNHNPEDIYTLNGNFLKKYSNKIIKTTPLRQKKKIYYGKNGAAIYITKINRINKYILGGKTSYLIRDKFVSIDIDDLNDFKLAELLHKITIKRK